MDTIGVVCEPDDPVFGRVAERLAARGFAVEFLAPGDPYDRSAVDGLDALAIAALTRQSLALLREADRVGVETWNGFVPATALSSRLVALYALERVGFRTPATGAAAGDEDAVATRPFRWDGPTGAERVRLAGYPRSAVTVRYYAVDDGLETHVHALTVRSKVVDREPVLGEATVDVELATRVRELLDRFDARAVGVDFRRADDELLAVDANPTPRFYGAGMERRVTDSLASLTPIGA